MASNDLRKLNRRRRARLAALHACLGTAAVALLFGVAYAGVCLAHGLPAIDASALRAVFAPAASAPFSAAPAQPAESARPAESAPSVESAQPTEPTPSAEPAPASPAAAARAWNVAQPLAAREGATDTDARILALPANGRVSDDYFRDALFIGDSVTQGFGWYPQYKDWMRVCAYKGINPNSILQNYIGRDSMGAEKAMWDEINAQEGVANIYILLGANALLQQSEEAFLKYYGDLLDRLRQRFPGVPIYVQSLTPTTQQYGLAKPALARDHLLEVNNAVAKMAVDKGLYYINLWEALADENGYLRADLSGDGLHLHDGSKYRPWLDYLAAHTVYSAHNAAFALAEEGVYS